MKFSAEPIQRRLLLERCCAAQLQVIPVGLNERSFSTL